MAKYTIRYVMRDDDGDKVTMSKSTDDPTTAITYALSKATRPRIKGERWVVSVDTTDDGRVIVLIDSVPSKGE